LTQTTYGVTDIEANGPIPGVHSMISFASAAVGEDGSDRGHFTVNLRPLDDATTDPHTMAWWKTQPEAWAEATRDPQDPKEAMASFVTWVRSLPGPAVFVAHPLAFDGGFIAWYLHRFIDVPLYDLPYRKGLTIGGLDLPSLVMGVYGRDFQQCNRRHYPEHWFGGHVHSHKALDDALGYAALLKRLLARLPGREGTAPPPKD